MSEARADGADELAPSREPAIPKRRAAVSGGASRAPVFAVFIELYEAALQALPPGRRRRRA